MVVFLWLIFSCVKILSANYSNGGKPLVLIPFMIKVSYHTSNITLRVNYLSAPLALWLLATISSWSVYCLFLLANKIVGGYIFQEDPIIRSVVKVLELSSISHFQLCVSTFSSLLPPLTGSWEVQYSISVIKTVEDNPSIILRTCLYSSSRLLYKQINKYICKIIYYTYCNILLCLNRHNKSVNRYEGVFSIHLIGDGINGISKELSWKLFKQGQKVL